MGKRFRRRYSNPATYLHCDGWNLLQEGSNAWGPSRVYVHGNRVDEIVWSYNTFTGEQAFHHYDARGHCTFLTGSAANILEHYEYDAFGKPYVFNSTGQPLNSSTFGNRFLFTGREYLSALKLYDYRNRMYQPEPGRFLQPDPKHFAAGDYNLYRYCHNDPVNKSDPLGLAAEINAEVQKLKQVTGSNIKQWVTIRKLTMDYKGASWKEAGMAAAAVAATAAHSDKKEYYGIVVRSPTNSRLFLATRPIPGEFGKVYGGYYNQSDLASLRVPGWTTAAAYWGIVRHQNSWPMHGKESDLDVLKRTDTNAVLGIPPADGAGPASKHVTFKIHDDHPVP